MIRSAAHAIWVEPRVPEPPDTAWWDRVLVAILVPATLLEGTLRTDVPWPPLSIALALVCVVALLWRRSHPLGMVLLAFGAQTAAGLAPHVVGHNDQVLYTTSCVLLFPYSLCRWARGRDAVLGLLFVLACHFGREPILGTTTFDLILGSGFLMFPAALGAAVRFQRSARSREVDQVRMREREQLARELHDTVAHHVSGIVIQAQAGRTIAATDPERAAGVLAVIEEAATRSLAEMRSIVGLLRSGEEAELAPVPGVADLRRLARDPAGHLKVDVALTGDLDHLGSSVDTAVYRVVQESITNARRHARHATQIDVRVAGDDDAVRVTIADDGHGSAPDSAGSGFGLVGMAERVELLGGTFSAGPAAGGGWRVTAELPRAGADA